MQATPEPHTCAVHGHSIYPLLKSEIGEFHIQIFVMWMDGSGIAISASSMSQVVVMEVQHVIFSKPHKFRRPQQQLPSQLQNSRLIIHQPKSLFTPRTARTLTGIPPHCKFSLTDCCNAACCLTDCQLPRENEDINARASVRTEQKMAGSLAAH